MTLIAPRHICRWLGHKREGYKAGYFYDRRGRQRDRWHVRCIRCGTSDGETVYEPGRLEWARSWSGRWRFRYTRAAIANWWRQDCEDCHKPTVRFGRNIGEHEDCNVIPF